jgi:hypothetical protein
VLLTGLIVVALSIPVLTIPLALAVGIRHLRRYLLAESSTMGDIWIDIKRGILRSLPIGAATVVIGLLLVLDLALATDRVLPLWEVILVLGWIGVAALSVTVVTTASAWTPERGWLAAVRLCPSLWARDPAGLVYLLASIAFVVVVTWQFAPLVVPGVGCLVLAVIAIPERKERPDADADD